MQAMWVIQLSQIQVSALFSPKKEEIQGSWQDLPTK